MSQHKEKLITLHHVTESGSDTGYFENKRFEVRIGETVIGRGNTVEEAYADCGYAENIRNEGDLNLD